MSAGDSTARRAIALGAGDLERLREGAPRVRATDDKTVAIRFVLPSGAVHEARIPAEQEVALVKLYLQQHCDVVAEALTLTVGGAEMMDFLSLGDSPGVVADGVTEITVAEDPEIVRAMRRDDGEGEDSSSSDSDSSSSDSDSSSSEEDA